MGIQCFFDLILFILIVYLFLPLFASYCTKGMWPMWPMWRNLTVCPCFAHVGFVRSSTPATRTSSSLLSTTVRFLMPPKGKKTKQKEAPSSGSRKSSRTVCESLRLSLADYTSHRDLMF